MAFVVTEMDDSHILRYQWIRTESIGQKGDGNIFKVTLPYSVQLKLKND